MTSFEEVLGMLKTKAKSERLEGMSRYGMDVERRLGVSVPEMRKIAKEIGKNHELASKLWATGISEAMIIASMIDEPEKVNEAQMEDWVKDINSWDVCDQTCMNLFEKTPLSWKKIADWSDREEEFVKRTAFSLLACLAWHDKNALDDEFTRMFPLIKEGSWDERNFVKKAVNWSIRNIGKRNLYLNDAAIKLCYEILDYDSKAAKWIARNAIKELEKKALSMKKG